MRCGDEVFWGKIARASVIWGPTRRGAGPGVGRNSRRGKDFRTTATERGAEWAYRDPTVSRFFYVPAETQNRHSFSTDHRGPCHHDPHKIYGPALAACDKPSAFFELADCSEE